MDKYLVIHYIFQIVYHLFYVVLKVSMIFYYYFFLIECLNKITLKQELFNANNIMQCECIITKDLKNFCSLRSHKNNIHTLYFCVMNLLIIVYQHLYIHLYIIDKQLYDTYKVLITLVHSNFVCVKLISLMSHFCALL